MKIIIRFVVVFLFILMPCGISVFALDYPFNQGDSILTQKKTDVVWTKIEQSTDVFRDWTEAVAEWIWDAAWSEKIFYEEVTTTAEAWTEISRTRKWIINWTLWIAWLAALVYLLYHWFLALTAWTDEEQLKKWQWWIKYALIAVFGIAVAWFMISIIFWLIWLLVA